MPRRRPGLRRLIKDLKQRGMLDETLVVWGGEFGRTAYCQGKLTRKTTAATITLAASPSGWPAAGVQARHHLRAHRRLRLQHHRRRRQRAPRPRSRQREHLDARHDAHPRSGPCDRQEKARGLVPGSPRTSCSGRGSSMRCSLPDASRYSTSAIVTWTLPELSQNTPGTSFIESISSPACCATKVPPRPISNA